MPDPRTFVPAQQLAATNQAHHPNESPEYRVARNSLLAEEIELRRHLERVAAQRRALPLGGRIEKTLELITESGPILFSNLFGEKDTLLVYSMMYGPQRKSPCPMCSSSSASLAAGRFSCGSGADRANFSWWPRTRVLRNTNVTSASTRTVTLAQEALCSVDRPVTCTSSHKI